MHPEIRVPVNMAMLKIIAKRAWSEGEMVVTLANVMKGLSIFVV